MAAQTNADAIADLAENPDPTSIMSSEVATDVESESERHHSA